MRAFVQATSAFQSCSQWIHESRLVALEKIVGCIFSRYPPCRFDGVDVGADSKPALVDFDGDGDLDLVVGNANGGLSYFESNGDGTFAERSGNSNPFHSIVLDAGTAPSFVDHDGDGDMDLVCGAEDGSLRSRRSSVLGLHITLGRYIRCILDISDRITR